MKIEFEKVVVSNFMSFGRSEVILDEPGYTLVRGINNNTKDMAVSNGSGKSAIWEAITWALTGETIRGCKNVVNSLGDDGALVELTFKANGDEYIITRTKDHSKLKSSLMIKVNGADKSGKGIRDSEKLLEQYLPEVTSSLIGSVIILGQGMPARFTNNTPSGRKEVLEKLSNSDFMIEDIKERISKRIFSLNLEKQSVENKTLALNTELSILKKDRDSKQTSLDNSKSIKELEEQRIEIEQQLFSATNEEKEEAKLVEDCELDVTTARDVVTNLKLESAHTEMELSTIFDTKIKPIELESMRLRAEIDSTKKEIRKKESVVDVCPTCGQKLVGVSKPDTTVDKAHLKELETLISSTTLELNELTTEKDSKIKEHKATVSERIADAEKQLKMAEALLTTHTIKQRMLTKNISDLNNELTKVVSEINNSATIIKGLEDDIASIDSRVVDINEKLLYNDSEIARISSHLEVLNKMNTSIKREFRGRLLSNVITYLDNRAKMYCQDVLGHNNIAFKLDGNNVAVIINDKEYEQLSGGEKQKLDIIIQLSIRDMLCKYMGFSSNIFVLDEIFDNLDDVGSEKVLNLISTKLSDVTSVYIVTHHASIPIPVDRELVVVKNTAGLSGVE